MSPTSRYGSAQDFKYLVDYLHRNKIGVILDWVPGHFPKDAHGLANFDGTAVYEHQDPQQGEHPDWGTKIYNYGRPEVKNFLIANALFWIVGMSYGPDFEWMQLRPCCILIMASRTDSGLQINTGTIKIWKPLNFSNI